MKAPIYHLDTSNANSALVTVACGKKKGLAMEEQEFRKRMKDGFESLFLCETCIKIAKSKKNVKA